MTFSDEKVHLEKVGNYCTASVVKQRNAVSGPAMPASISGCSRRARYHDYKSSQLAGARV